MLEKRTGSVAVSNLAHERFRPVLPRVSKSRNGKVDNQLGRLRYSVYLAFRHQLTARYREINFAERKQSSPLDNESRLAEQIHQRYPRSASRNCKYRVVDVIQKARDTRVRLVRAVSRRYTLRIHGNRRPRAIYRVEES